jgi:hypothetical protein
VTQETATINDLMPVDDPHNRLSSEDLVALEEIRTVLARHNLLDRFGVMLLHKHFDLASGERLIERTDVEARRQTITVMTAEETGDAEVLETAWRFLPKGQRGPIMGCIMGCFGGSTQKCEYRDHTGVSDGPVMVRAVP